MERPHAATGTPPSANQSGFVAVNGARIYYETNGAGTPLVLVHAGIADRRQWDDQAEEFGSRYLVVRYDLRCWGRSDAPPGPVAFHEDLYGVLRALGLERAHILGSSMGGTMAIDFALTHPQMVASLVLVGSWLTGFPTEASPAEEAMREAFDVALEARDYDRANELEIDLKLAGIYRTPDQVDREVRERLLRIHRDAFNRLGERELMRPWLKPEPPAASRLGELCVPALVLYGDLDVPAVPRIAVVLGREIAGAQTAVMHGTAHVPNMEQPRVFNRIVLDFLAGVEQREARQ